MFLELQLLLSVGLEMDSRFLIGFSLNWFWLFFELVLTKDKLFHFARLIDKSGSFYLTVHKLETLNAQSRGKNSFRLVALSHLHKSNSIICCLTILT